MASHEEPRAVAETHQFLIEIGTEELPPKALRGLSEAFLEGIRVGLSDRHLAFAEAIAFATPRRLAVRVDALAARQPDRDLERRGPPVAVAQDKDGAPTRAGLKFAESCGVPFDALDRLDTDKGAYVAFRGREPGRPAADVLPEVIEEALSTLPIPRRMRWGDTDFEFVRPVHWIVALMDTDVLPIELFGIQADRLTRGHRFLAPGPFSIPDASVYSELLEKSGCVSADFAARRNRVLAETMRTAAGAGGKPVYDDDLVDEVTALVEWPVPVAGAFNERFLDLPREVLVSTLQAHQRYFPIEDEDGRLLRRFVATANIESQDPDKVREGIERVVLPRLSDAGFFWDTDRRRTLASRRKDLENVIFQRKLGSMADRSRRVEQLAAQIAERLGHDSRSVARAAALAKCDLLTDMVGEFPDLQGVMGRYYALHDGEPGEVAVAIEEQYLPRFAGDRIPSTACGRILSLADKLDTLTGIFAIGARPSGTKDPFGLRRAALGALRILIEGNLELQLPELLAAAASQQPGTHDSDAVASDVLGYTMERLKAYYTEGVGELTAPVEAFEAVYARRPASVLDFHRRLQAVLAFGKLPAAESLSAANKRVANILRQAERVDLPAPDPGQMVEPEEKSLFEALLVLREQVEPLLETRDYGAALERLASLRDPVDAFFDRVMVMDENPILRENRLALLSQMRQLFLHTADLSKLGG
jgi:glycyl-tRNA synthetase beta chain